MNFLNNYNNKLKGRLFLLSMVIGVSLTVSGCKKQPEPSLNTTPSPSSVTTPTPAPVTEIAGQAYTNIYDDIPQRNQNLNLAIEAIHGKIINPYEEFSFNQTVGERTEEKGYLKATGYDEHGEKEPTVGGGICQISSTLYMAAKNGNFPVTERHSHSHPVPYADPDNDATVSYGGYDFKFQNNRDKPIMIHMETDGKTVYAELELIHTKIP